MTVGFLLQLEQYCVGSFVRWLQPSTDYVLLLHFFHATSWTLVDVMVVWMKLFKGKFPMIPINVRLLAIGDGIKESMESKC